DANRNDAAVLEFRALLAGEPVSANARLPTGRGFWDNLLHHGALPDWHDVTAQLNVENAKFSTLAAWLPEAIAPQGRLDLEVHLERGQFTGKAQIEDAATRSLGALGPVRDIHAQVLLAGRRLMLTNFGVEIGGQPVNA